MPPPGTRYAGPRPAPLHAQPLVGCRRDPAGEQGVDPCGHVERRGLGLEFRPGLQRSVDRDDEARAVAALDARRDQRYVQAQGEPGRHQCGGGGHVEKRHLLAAIEALVGEQAHAAPLLQLAQNGAGGLTDLEKAAAERTAPAVHQLLDRRIGLPAIDHAERDARAHRRDRQEIPVGEVRRHEDPRPAAVADMASAAEIDHPHAILGGVADAFQAGIFGQHPAERSPDPRCRGLHLRLRPFRKRSGEVESPRAAACADAARSVEPGARRGPRPCRCRLRPAHAKIAPARRLRSAIRDRAVRATDRSAGSGGS